MDIQSNSDSDSLSEYEFGRVALAYDPDQLTSGHGPPQNGHDYLRLVQIERANLPVFCQAKRFKNDHVEIISPGKTQPIESEGDLLFKGEIMANFIKLRQYIYGQRCDKNYLTEKSDSMTDQIGITEQTRKVIKMTEQELITALDNVIFEEEQFDPEWIYSLLAALREPIDADTCNTIRQIARVCQTKRKNNPKDLGSLLIICIVRNQFDQRDITIC